MRLDLNAVRSMVSAPLQVFIGGEKPKEALLDGLKSCVINTVGGVLAKDLGDLYDKGDLPYLAHKGGHFITGFLLSLGLSEGDIKEALGAGLAATMAEVTAESLPSSLSREARGNIAKVGGSLIGVLTGAKKGTGIFTACNAIDHNFLWTIPLASALTPEMLAVMGLSGMTAYQLGQWLKDHPLLMDMDMLPEGILWKDRGFMPEESKAEVLTTPSHEDKPLLLHTPIERIKSLIHEQKFARTSAEKEQAEANLKAYAQELYKQDPTLKSIRNKDMEMTKQIRSILFKEHKSYATKSSENNQPVRPQI
ncbi:hypothetical protein IM40_07350 [Candidatus Paracaedimonas acanthamoebae]|nr:hypothetical protein IM40_07350 [Candidatus Paracaedimonas acanthamoebae]